MLRTAVGEVPTGAVGQNGRRTRWANCLAKLTRRKFGADVRQALASVRQAIEYRKDVLAFAYACCKANGGAAGVDGQTLRASRSTEWNGGWTNWRKN